MLLQQPPAARLLPEMMRLLLLCRPHAGLHLLVNNAGVHLKPYARVSCDVERVMASNYLGHWWLTHLLLDDLRRSAPAR